ncbi:MAG: molybdopterin-dependent oxidoreductase [Armatimonadota bacterium]|nr:molybdopterin-dependent oxidoreductase [Armatimonadota bacterium]MDR7470334.1 molybdopterin-dependent oxidoreductase [Armatimonadota bacterium]MDR7475246.1 molybdopterin-dependent oxidoreductase [Armatimonadota bacterium]MDR7539540.1 molybdopterin-dependent oxidoreductase [Armatimonadota bacterium]
MSRGARGALGGATAGVLAVSLMLRGTFTAGFPVVALALWERTLRLLPVEVFGFLIVRLKFLAKPLAFWGMLAGMVAAWALLGYVLGRAPWGQPSAGHGGAPEGGGSAARVAATRFLVAFLAAFVPLVGLTFTPGAEYMRGRLQGMGVLEPDPTSVAARILGALAVYAGLFALLVTGAVLWPPARRFGPAGGDSRTRRELLGRWLALALGTLTGASLWQWLAALRPSAAAPPGAPGRLGAISPTAQERAAAAGGPAVTAQSPFTRVRGLPPEVTPTDQFYVVSKNPPGLDPVLRADRWRLEVAVRPDRPLVMGLDELKAMPAVRRPHTLECISNEVGGDLIGNAYWRGVRLRDVVARAGGLPPTAIKLVFRCADGYTESLPVAEALHPDTLLVYEMNGEPLPPRHGFPLRLLVPGLFGMKNPKWITRIEAADFDFQGFWERSGWSDQAVVQTMSKFTIPSPLRAKAGEEVGLGGVAYAGARRIRAVEVSPDDGRAWLAAQVKAPLGPYTWVLWAVVWTPAAPGEYRVRVRARDGTGALQTAQPSPPLPEGATGHHIIRIRVGK